MAEKEKWLASQVRDAIEVAHPGPDQWVVLHEVPDATSWDKGRTADSIAFGCWKSAGISIHGYEIKVSRSDWLREIQNPHKSEAFVQRCNYWWVICPEGIVNIEEMPANWGLKIVKRTSDDTYSVRVKKAATHNATPSLDVGFLCAAIRCAWKRSPEGTEHDKVLKAEYDRGYSLGETYGERRAQDRNLQFEIDELKEVMAKFEKASGLTIDRWDADDIGKAVKAFMLLEEGKRALEYPIQTMERLLNQAKGLMS